jgi:uncharacterized NAD(P)/FAD-binding protein YdhS
MRCAIIGGGYSGAVAAIALLKRLPSGHSITIYDPCKEIGRGIAYARGPDHRLLNVAAHTVALTPDEKGDFCTWAVSRFRDADRYREADGAYYFPRLWFGTYMQERLASAIAASPKVSLIHQISVALAVEQQGERLLVRSAEGAQVFDKVIFAIGNAPPSPVRSLESCESPIVAQSAWEFDPTNLSKTAHVVIVGSGLTMADVVADLEACGHQGPIVCISRNGRRPHPSVGVRAEYTPGDEGPPPATARQLVRTVRAWAAETVAQGGHWISSVDHVIRHTPALWRSLSPIERSRLRRHARSLWEIHRYKMPPVAHRRIEALIAAGRFTHLRAKVLGIASGGVQIQDANGVRKEPADIIINASGFDTTYRTARAPLSGLLEGSGIDVDSVVKDGFAVDDHGRLLQARPYARGRLYGLGFLARANHGDMGTVNIIGAVAAGIAEDIGYSAGAGEAAQPSVVCVS